MRVWTTVMLILALSLAGCSDKKTADDGPGLVVDDQTGGIRGVVIDPAIRPIPGASVFLMTDPPRETQAADDGGFSFVGLDPGSYNVRASHPLYSTTSSLVDVEAGVERPPMVKLVLERVASGEPYMATIKESGFISCSANVLVGKSEECGEGVGVEGQGRVGKNENNRAQIDFTLDGPHIKTLIVEFVWEPNTEVGTGESSGQFDSRVATQWSCEPVCQGNTLAQASGGSPLLLRVDEEALASIENLTAETVFSTFTWAEDNPGVLLDQDYDVFISTFYYLPAPEGWSFVEGSPDPF